MSNSEKYINAAIRNEAAIVSKALPSIRNQTLNRAAFKLGTIPGITTDTAIGALMLASRENGYIKEHGEVATRKVVESGFKNGQRKHRILPAQNASSPRLSAATSHTESGGIVGEASRDQKLPKSNALPVWTTPDEKGEPEFHEFGKEGPPVRSNEIRRHIYSSGGQARRVKIKIKSASGRDTWFNVYRVVNQDGIVGWQYAKPADYGLIPYPDIDPFDRELAADDVIWPEGERDADSIVRLGLLSITFGGTGDGLPPGCEKFFAGRNVVILADNDEGGSKHAEQKAALIHPIARSVRIVHFPELPEKGDVSDWLALGNGREQLLGRVEKVQTWTPSIDGNNVPLEAAKRRLISHRASDLKPERLIWIWPGRIPEGKLVLLGGPPGLGKSQLTAFISAVVSNGGSWPCGEGSTLPGDVIFMSAEDGIRDTIVPRLMAAGANTSRVHIVAAATKPDGTGRKTFSLKTDVDLLEAKAKEIGSVRLIIVDPISAYMGGADGNGNVETREVLEPLSEMADRLRIAVVAVTHLNKGGAGGQSALNRFAGSIAFVAAARAAFLVVEDSEDDGRRLLLQAKNNLGAKCNGLAFRLEQRIVDGDILSSNVTFESEHVSQSIDEALTASESRGGAAGCQTSKDDAAEFLSDVLAHGPRDVLEVESLARAATLLGADKPLRQNKAFRDARKDLGVIASREGFGPGARYVLSLPGTPCAPKNTMCAPFQTRAHMDNPGAHEETVGAIADNLPTRIR